MDDRGRGPENVKKRDIQRGKMFKGGGEKNKNIVVEKEGRKSPRTAVWGGEKQGESHMLTWELDRKQEVGKEKYESEKKERRNAEREQEKASGCRRRGRQEKKVWMGNAHCVTGSHRIRWVQCLNQVAKLSTGGLPSRCRPPLITRWMLAQHRGVGGREAA